MRCILFEAIQLQLLYRMCGIAAPSSCNKNSSKIFTVIPAPMFALKQRMVKMIYGEETAPQHNVAVRVGITSCTQFSEWWLSTMRYIVSFTTALPLSERNILCFSHVVQIYEHLFSFWEMCITN